MYYLCVFLDVLKKNCVYSVVAPWMSKLHYREHLEIVCVTCLSYN